MVINLIHSDTNHILDLFYFLKDISTYVVIKKYKVTPYIYASQLMYIVIFRSTYMHQEKG